MGGFWVDLIKVSVCVSGDARRAHVDLERVSRLPSQIHKASHTLNSAYAYIQSVFCDDMGVAARLTRAIAEAHSFQLHLSHGSICEATTYSTAHDAKPL